MSTNNYKFPDGGIYCGELNAQKLPEGKGTCEWPDGSKYDGYWVDGKKHGTGLMISAHETIKGFWYEDDLIRVFSKESSQEQDSKPPISESYVGEKNSENKPHGKGKYTYADGSTYDGYWVNGVKHGSGTQCDANGDIVRGFWYEDELLHTFSTIPAPKKLAKNTNKIVALLIGNNYTGTDNELPKCISDAEIVGQKLRNIGADVTIMRNASETDIHNAIKAVCGKDNQYEHAVFYFSGHGQIKHYNYNIEDEDGNIVGRRILGPLHTWIGEDLVPVYQEWDLLKNIKDSQFKNIVIINDACQTTRVYDFDDLGEVDKCVVMEAYTSQNEWQNRNLLTAYAALEGWTASGWSNDKCGIYALGLIQYIEQENLPLLKMFAYVNDFVVKYSMREKGEILQLPNASFTKFDASFCLYTPEHEE